jgi:hypothetical protein
MERNKPPVKRKQPPSNEPPWGFFGGCIPNPPKWCIGKVRHVDGYGRQYIDCACCSTCKKEPTCSFYRTHRMKCKLFYKNGHN